MREQVDHDGRVSAEDGAGRSDGWLTDERKVAAKDEAWWWCMLSRVLTPRSVRTEDTRREVDEQESRRAHLPLDLSAGSELNEHVDQLCDEVKFRSNQMILRDARYAASRRAGR